MNEGRAMVAEGLVNPTDSSARKVEKLMRIAEVLMRQVEQITDDRGAAYAQFQRAVLLEDQVRERTRELGHALDLLNASNARLAEANRETEAARQNLANAIETIQEGFALFDANDILVMCNSRFGMHMSDIRPHLKPGLTFTDYVSLVSRSRYLELPATETPEDWSIRRRNRHKDRHVIFNVRMIWDRWVQVSEHRTRDEGTVILQTDVTDIIRLERQERGKMLDDQARIIRATLDHISQGVAIFDSQTRLLGWNDRLGQLLAIPLSRIRRGLEFRSLLERLGAEATFAAGMTQAALIDWAEATTPRPALNFELSRGDTLIMDVSAQEMPDRGFVISFTDVTAERAAVIAIRRANETLEQRVLERTLDLEDALASAERANAARARFVAAASHDLLQPLSAAKLFVASAGDESVSPHGRDTLAKAQNALESVEQILGALLDISRLENGEGTVDLAAIRLDRMLQQLYDEFAPMAQRKGIALRIVPASVVVTSDTSYLRRILQNLIGNAIRYTQTGRVLVGARRAAGAIRVEVWDTGPGIAEEDQDAIFREFHRLNARASASEGMGLGLAIVDRACALLGHPLDLRSVPGQGTMFSVTLPLAGTRPLPDARLPEPESGGLSDRLVLLVENDADLRRAMCLLLEKWNVSVLDCENTEDALALMDEVDIIPDILLIDYQLGPGADGLACLAALRSRFGNRPSRIITADRSAATRAACAAAGVEILAKPIDAAALEVFLAAAGAPSPPSGGPPNSTGAGAARLTGGFAGA
ncbi:MAG: PAS-domain containing protein [Paracoccaceae bacterium]